MDVRIDSGMDTAMISVLRQLPRNRRIMSAVRQAAIMASRITPFTAARTNNDWSAIGSIFNAGGSVAAIRGISSRTFLTISSVDADPVFMTTNSTPRWPSRRTMLV